MPVPNFGPGRPDHGEPDPFEHARRGNPAPVLRDEPLLGDVAAASARASVVTHRFGGVRYALSRPDPTAADREPPSEEGGSDARH